MFVLHSKYTGDTSCRVWFDLNLSLTRENFYIFENRKGEKVHVPDWNTNFFSMKVRRTILLVSESTYPEDTPYQVWFCWTASWPDKNDLFIKFLFREIQKVLYEILTFFLGNLHQKFFLFYILITLVIIQAEFGLIWTTPWPDEKDLFLKSLFGEIQKVPYEILTFFRGKLTKSFFRFTF